jgi:hypothetical protein
MRARVLVATAVLFGVLAFGTSTGFAFQARGSTAGSGIKACSILTRDLVEPFTENKRLLDLVPPEDEKTAAYSACEYGIVRLQLFSARPDADRTAPKDFQPLTGVGEKAYFHNNRDDYAELLVWSGAHYFTLQVSVPTGSTAEAIRPKAITLANAIIQKLR